MTVFLYGANSYSRGRKLREILSVYCEKMGGQRPKEFDLSEGADVGLTQELVSYLKSQSMFAEKKFVLVINPFQDGDKKVLKNALKEAAEDKGQIVIIVSEDEAPKSFGYLLEKPSVSQAFPEIKKGKELEAFISKEAAIRELKLAKDDVKNLIDAFGSDLWAIATELDKLSFTEKGGTEEAITHDFFKTLTAIKFSAGRKEKLIALEILLSSRGDDAAKIFNMLSFGLNDPQKLNALSDYDVMIKTGKLDYEEALLDFALNL